MRFLVLLLSFALACSQPEPPPRPVQRAPVFPHLARFEPMQIPAENPLTPAKVELGRKLFADPRLSGDGSTSCTGCHDPKYGYTIGAAKPIGAYGVEQNRACPSLINAGYAKGYYWENVPIPLEKAIDGVWRFILVPKGEGRPTIEQVVARLNADAALRTAFASAFQSPATRENVTQALASFIRTLVPSGSAWVRFHDGDRNALSGQARRGYEIFDRKAHCTNCHSGVLLSDRLNHGIGTDGAMKTPTLLNIASSAPYFHDNRSVSLEDAVDRMLAGGFPAKTPDPQLKPVELTAEERALLLAFLRELTALPPTPVAAP
ncbi:MAG: cytochrome-c peroxidase [Thermoanaerobaculia bacterium]